MEAYPIVLVGQKPTLAATGEPADSSKKVNKLTSKLGVNLTMKHRPSYHYTRKKDYMGDICAPIYFNGEYHAFYQTSPGSEGYGYMPWAHVTSHDLLHWEDKGIALFPDKSRGETACFCGCSYIKDGKVELLYTSVGPSRPALHGCEQWVATTEDMVTWRQIPENPVIDMSIHEFKVTEWRDPFVFRYRGENLMVANAIVDDLFGSILIYRSKDMRNWEYLNVFLRNPIPVTYECPAVYVFGDKLVLRRGVLPYKNNIHVVGTLNDDYSFNQITHDRDVTPVDYGIFDDINLLYDMDGRCITFSHCPDKIQLYGDVLDDRFIGTLSAREISLREDNRLIIKPLREFESLRSSEAESVRLENFSGNYEFKTKSTTFEMCASIKAEEEFTIRILGATDTPEHTDIHFNPQKGTYCLDLTESTMLKTNTNPVKNWLEFQDFPPLSKQEPNGIITDPIKGWYDKKDTGKCDITVMVDHSFIEIFVNDTSALTAYAFPFSDDIGKIEFIANNVANAQFDIYTMSLKNATADKKDVVISK
ncbi:glycoside hydrolase family 32 protein [Bacillus sp. FSL K6-3431]|uniref:glycoside hydrolase family 32 protein n=1 Tax=Bacillus sp. FSL K6-3431 TaxID=2921500 RepID=UPI0030FB33C8